MPNGSKLWRLAYRFGRKQKLLALGPYPELTLSDARVERDHAKRHLAKAVDPSEAKKQAKAERAEVTNTFQVIAEEFLTQQRRNGRATVTIEKAEWLFGFAYPTLGDRDIRDIRAPDVLDVLQKVEIRGRYVTACRLRSTIGRVFRFAIATGRAEVDPTLSLRGARARNRARLRSDTESILKARGAKMDTDPSPTIALPLLSAPQDESRDELIDLWAHLLACALDAARRKNYRRGFVGIAKALEPLDVLVLPILARPGEFAPSKLEFIANETGLSRDQVELSFRSLIRLELTWPTQAQIQNVRSQPFLTALGRQFLAAVQE